MIPNQSESEKILIDAFKEISQICQETIALLKAKYPELLEGADQ